MLRHAQLALPLGYLLLVWGAHAGRHPHPSTLPHRRRLPWGATLPPCCFPNVAFLHCRPPLQDDGLAPASHLLLVDTLFLLRDALDQALGMATPTPAWAAAYGYAPGRGAPYPADAALFEAAGFAQAEEAAAAAEGAQPELGDASIAARRRRLSQQPPLPEGDAPSVVAELQSTGDAYEGYEYR